MDFDIVYDTFVWNSVKERQNRRQHGVDFKLASEVFFDQHRVIITDEIHSRDEERFFCLGLVSEKVLTVRFTYRDGKIRIFGAGYWRKGRKIYETKNKK